MIVLRNNFKDNFEKAHLQQKQLFSGTQAELKKGEFPEQVQTAFNPPPLSFQNFSVQIFRKYAVIYVNLQPILLGWK